MVSDSQFQALQQKVDTLEKLLRMKILGNDTSTNYGLPAQLILYGLANAANVSLTANGVRTTLNNDNDPDLGQTVSLESEDISVSNGDKSALAPNGYFVMAWDGAAYQVIAFITDGGSGYGAIGLANVSSSNAVTMEASTPQVQVTNGVSTSALLPSGIIVDNGIGIDAVVPAAFTQLTFTKGILTGFTP